jgi:hypothetical protein
MSVNGWEPPIDSGRGAYHQKSRTVTDGVENGCGSDAVFPIEADPLLTSSVDEQAMAIQRRNPANDLGRRSVHRAGLSVLALPASWSDQVIDTRLEPPDLTDGIFGRLGHANAAAPGASRALSP